MSTNKTSITGGFVVIVLTIALLAVTSVLLHVLFSTALSDLAIEILAAVLAVILVIASIGVTIHFQNQSETERAYRVCLFEHKMKEYTKFLELTARSDDDGTISQNEIEQIRNQAKIAAMLAGKDLVVCLAEFISNLETTRKLYSENAADRGTFQRIIISMREDIGVVDDTSPDTEKEIGLLVRRPEAE